MKPVVQVAGVLALMACAWVGGVLLLQYLHTAIPALRAVVWVDESGGFVWQVLAVPVGLVAVFAVTLLIELRARGWEQSALRRLTVAPTRSSRVDRFCLLLRLSGGMHVLAFLCSFGLAFAGGRALHDVLGWRLAEGWAWPWQLLATALVHSFVFYWGHRLMHTRWFWTLHKVHHAAEEMNLVTPLRNHPLDLVVMTLLHAGPAGMLGVSPMVVLVYSGLHALHQSWLHSERVTPRAFWNHLLMTPDAHRLHHSSRPEHFDTNFGVFPLWDWLFGTYLRPSDTGQPQALTYGVPDADLYNRPEYFREMFDNVRRWLMEWRRPAGSR